MENSNCPLCKSCTSVEIRRLLSRQLIDKYRNVFNLDTSRFFLASEISINQCIDCGLKRYNQVLAGDEVFYDMIQNATCYYETDKPEYSFALSKIAAAKPLSVLDVGCGEGFFLQKIRKICDVKGLEFSDKSILKLAEKGIRHDNIADDYDFIVAFQVLEHVYETYEFLDRLIKKLKKNGFILITVPNNDSKYFHEVYDVLDYPPHHLTQWNKMALESISTIFKMDIVDYYLEPHRIEHYSTLISSRRKKILPSGIRGKMLHLFGEITDRILAPYFFDGINYPGHTHGILLQKRK